ncbi:peptidyl-prolyl cis-trans isomerase FKBP19 [Citrus sinensis]|uniref:Peptidyl-prolyl cis-trans isomerase FKBP19 n=1 Tax=Citrus sinensis TaxID=2711 RepID=A0ACB8IN00_CITSI|nr:peptidyl-prolyl cis-trans isomerase FKBP19 [Citrus sinensis]
MASISISALGSSSSSSAIKPSSSVRHRFHSKNNPPLLFHRQLAPQSLHHPHQFNGSSSYGEISHTSNRQVVERRRVLISSIGLLAVALFNASKDGVVLAAEFADMPALRGKDYGKTKMRYPDYTETESGLQYKVDWDGYTIGYYGRIFEARNKTKGGSFEGDDKDYFKFRLGSQDVIPAFEEAVSGMALGGVRRIIVPPEIGYPENDYNKSGPRPTTFSCKKWKFMDSYHLMEGLKMNVDAARKASGVRVVVWDSSGDLMIAAARQSTFHGDIAFFEPEAITRHGRNCISLSLYFKTYWLQSYHHIAKSWRRVPSSLLPLLWPWPRLSHFLQNSKETVNLTRFSELRRKWDSNGQDECNGNNVDGMAAFANTCDMTLFSDSESDVKQKGMIASAIQELEQEAVSMAGYDGCGWVRHQLHH